MTPIRRVIVLGLDGLEPSIVQRLLERGELPNMARLAEAGGLTRVATTTPAQTPVAWSTFATGLNPGGHGIFDFLRRDPDTYLPDLGLNEFRQTSKLLPPAPVNLRGGRTVWDVLGDAGIPSTILRCPCTYPPEKMKGRLLAGLGVPDMRGGFGTPTLFTTDPGRTAGESENLMRLRFDNGRAKGRLLGPGRAGGQPDAEVVLDLRLDADARAVDIRAPGLGRRVRAEEGHWSDWLRVKFKLNRFQSAHGIVRFRLLGLEPHVELYASPVNLNPRAPMFPISAPWDYAGELDRALGTYYTAGFVEDHTGMSNGRLDEAAFLEQCELAMHERVAHLRYELDRFDSGLLYCLFDTSDRVQHMFWRFGEPSHPANRGSDVGPWAHVIGEYYRKCDAVVGEVLQRADDETLVVVLSDHGFSSFQRGLHLNTWLYDAGFLALRSGAVPGPDAGDFFKSVDWDRTKAYALGLGGIYLNRTGREANGILDPDGAREVAAAISRGLTGLEDGRRGVAVRGVKAADELYEGDFVDRAPDLAVLFSPGYRASWGTTLGGVPAGLFEDNVRAWSGDHVVDPDLVPGVLLMNRHFDGKAMLEDLAPTILAALGVPVPSAMEGRNLLAAEGAVMREGT